MGHQEANEYFEAFKLKEEEHAALTAESPIAKEAFQASIAGLEEVGLAMYQADGRRMRSFANVMHRVFTQAADIEVVPPFTKLETAQLAGKVTTYAMLSESRSATTEKPTGQKPTPSQKPTDTGKLKTGGAKR